MRDMMQGRLEIAIDELQIDSEFARQYPELQAGPHVCLTVRDSGHGMTPEVMKHIFEPFFTTKGASEGTGMGLAMVQGIITAHQGLILVHSVPGQGTTFTIYLPRIAGTISPVTPRQDSLVSGTGRILFVDDEELLTRWGQAALQSMGYTVHPSNSSKEALALFQRAPNEIDLVITDQTMPHMTGEKLVEALRAIRPDVPIILCTGFSHAMNEDKARALEINAFCMKPLTLHDLGAVVQQVLTQYRNAGAAAAPRES
jgi:CheY-like chemotaxis protein